MINSDEGLKRMMMRMAPAVSISSVARMAETASRFDMMALAIRLATWATKVIVVAIETPSI